MNKTESQPAIIGAKPAGDKAVVNVAVAVVHYQEQYLIGFRSSSQHQGNRYEFVGGKIDGYETASEALVREVSEEAGIDLQGNHLVKLGRLHHDYGDKQVCLHVYKIALTTEQYQQHQHSDYGLEGQALTWVAKIQLLAGYYPLPAANQTILAWLQLPAQITVTYPLTQFSESTDMSNEWLTYHQQHIPKEAWVYIRTKASDLESKVAKATKVTDAELAEQLMRLRFDTYSVLACNTADRLLTKAESVEKLKSEQSTEDIKLSQHVETSSQIVACHLTHYELMYWFNCFREKDSAGSHCKDKASDDPSKGSQFAVLGHPLPNLPLIVSCHDADSIHAANQLAATRLQHHLPPVIGIFLSPVLATQSHPDSEPFGWEAWSDLVQLADMPVIGLGGLSPMMAEQATQYGAMSIAGIRHFLQS